MKGLTYLDYASLTPPAPEALDAMREAAERSWGQPGSLHSIGGRALLALDIARRQVAEYLGITWQEVVFTSSGRDALRIAMCQALETVPKGSVIVASRQDHPSMQELVEAAGRDGYDVRWLALPGGVPDDEDLRQIGQASLVALSACNHELGTLLLDAIAEASPSALRVVDAVQVAPWLPLDALDDDRTFYAVSGAKLGAPLGIGVARVPSKTFYAARKSGRALETESPPWLMAIGLGAACEARVAKRAELLKVACARADELVASLRHIQPDLIVNGAAEARLGPIVNLSFPGQYGKSMVAALSLEGVCISHTTACQARRSEVSPVVRAAYPDEPDRAVAATRWSVSERVTSDDIARAAEALGRIVAPRRST